MGSLLRPASIRRQIEEIFGGLTTAVRPLVLPQKAAAVRELDELCDRIIPALVQRQIDAGLDVVTDGEVRRSIFLSSFYDAIEGLEAPDHPFEIRDEAGNVVYTGYADPLVAKRMRRAHRPLVAEVAYLHRVTDFPFKVTLPAPSYFYSDFMTLGSGAYPSRDHFVKHAVEIEKQIIAEATAAGARWIQFDFPIYPALVDKQYSDALLHELSESLDSLLDKALAADISVTEGIPDDTVVALHLCRGNLEGGFWSGSLAPIAERMYTELPHDRFLFEWEDVAREGDYEPIKFVPKGKVMVMGLVSTKTPQLEAEDDVMRHIEEASRFLDVAQLALSPQCGFASVYGDHLVQAEEAQWRKLELVGRVADRVWGAR